jgi:hypothetical protein
MGRALPLQAENGARYIALQSIRDSFGGVRGSQPLTPGNSVFFSLECLNQGTDALYGVYFILIRKAQLCDSPSVLRRYSP